MKLPLLLAILAPLLTGTATGQQRPHPSVQIRVQLSAHDVAKNPAAYHHKQVILTCPVTSTVAALDKDGKPNAVTETTVNGLRVILRPAAISYLIASRKCGRILTAYHAEVMTAPDTGKLALYLKSGANFSR